MKKPSKLYHATYKPLLSSIQKEGLGGKSSNPNWPDSKPGVTYWSVDADVAASYAETAEEVDESWLDQIIVFACKIENFDMKRLFLDRNVIDNDDVTFEYHGIIPFSSLEEVENG